MKTAKLEDMIKGWFVGNFEPTLLKTNDVEVAVKSYNKGDYEEKHYHKIATEITVITQGRVKMNGIEYKSGDIIVMEPNEATDFECLENETQNVVVKIPGANNDKYLGYLCISNCSRQMTWSANQVRTLSILSKIIFSAIGKLPLK